MGGGHLTYIATSMNNKAIPFPLTTRTLPKVEAHLPIIVISISFSNASHRYFVLPSIGGSMGEAREN